MNRDNIKGKGKDISGRVKRQVGEWTGDEQAQTEGALDQAEGKVQNAWGNVKDAGRKAMDDINRKDEEEIHPERKRDVA